MKPINPHEISDSFTEGRPFGPGLGFLGTAATAAGSAVLRGERFDGAFWVNPGFLREISGGLSGLRDFLLFKKEFLSDECWVHSDFDGI